MRAFALDHSLFAAWLAYRFTRLDVRRRWMTRYIEAGQTPNPPATAAEGARRARQQHALAEAFRLFAAALRTRGTPGLVVLFPALDHDFAIYPHAPYHDLIAQAATGHGLPFLDLLPCFRGYPAIDLAVDPLHPNPAGHRIAAHAIFQAIAELGLLPGTSFEVAEPGSCRDYRLDGFPSVRGY